MLRRFHRIIIALLLATLPVMGLAGFVREGQSGCAMHMQGDMHGTQAGQGEHSMTMAEHCKAMHAAAKATCEKGGHCAMCDDLSTSLAVTELPLPAPAAAQGITSQGVDFLLDSTVAGLWRPPRFG